MQLWTISTWLWTSQLVRYSMCSKIGLKYKSESRLNKWTWLDYLPGWFLLFVDIMAKEGSFCVFPLRRLYMAAVEQCDVWQVANHKVAPLCLVIALHSNQHVIIIIIIRTFIKRHKSRHIHSEALYMSKYTCVVEL